MPLVITPIIGKRDLLDRVLVSRMSDGEATEELRRRQAGASVVKIRLRKELNTPLWRNLCSSRVRDVIASRMENILQDGFLSMTTRRRFDPEQNRTVVEERVEVAFGDEVTVTAQAATLLLDHPTYSYLLEEVDAPSPVRRLTRRGTASVSEIATHADESALAAHKEAAAREAEKDAEIALLRSMLAQARLDASPPVAGVAVGEAFLDVVPDEVSPPAGGPPPPAPSVPDEISPPAGGPPPPASSKRAKST